MLKSRLYINKILIMTTRTLMVMETPVEMLVNFKYKEQSQWLKEKRKKWRN